MITRKPSGPYLIESSPQYKRYLAAKAAREIVERLLSPVAILSAAVGGYRSELDHVLSADAVYFGTGK